MLMKPALLAALGWVAVEMMSSCHLIYKACCCHTWPVHRQVRETTGAAQQKQSPYYEELLKAQESAQNGQLGLWNKVLGDHNVAMGSAVCSISLSGCKGLQPTLHHTMSLLGVNQLQVTRTLAMSTISRVNPVSSLVQAHSTVRMIAAVPMMLVAGHQCHCCLLDSCTCC